ncbi:single-stranded-DNA-specific exonuclease RecJ [Candidatus Peregrinibacteria bacterium]|jgi:single-stranded-DNA-specific exonuclease|nr:single-stranded-DNA-specific exonuclease RecJ [Candidatus Peregrinibacteria bacterium]MBT3598538.1 single-stranded-DNA-specific exonuclease RecJ [Candidatus Peregrinibacteria bacterium]MBT4367651.1 single-stranded-DNA-specific exonuclease RecJ [Candidatus Peregrinibacteria bacterium]MBT4586199.1 single-stranded-DNA-specific exonuclease RecJ [Candidatus Peregrinibacteria bacterium]MBT6730494.1 single-stranded-DNA-specific exonuclease RecJ [Candidatus Peregrinibacteria bacterium]
MSDQLSFTGKKWDIDSSLQNIDPCDLADSLIQNRSLSSIIENGSYPGMQIAINRILLAIKQGEAIGIFGDYDCDGITGTAQLLRFFRRHDIEPSVRLPHRVNDGYGLNEEAIRQFKTDGINLLITVDTGITSVNEIDLANELGIDVIITDHHKPRKNIPNALCILHPHLASNMPEPFPSGAGVVYQLLCELEDNQWEEKDTDCALAMIGTIADVVPLIGANRTLVEEGLISLKKLNNCPLSDLRDSTGAQTSTDIAFKIAPRINAAGRMSDPMIALNAIVDGGQNQIDLEELNSKRQSEMNDLYEKAIEEIRKTESSPLLMTASADYPHGIIGLIAGRLTEAYGKPSCAIAINNNICTASLRSPACYNITDGLEQCSNLLMSFGGHAQAAGCTFELKNMDEIRLQLSKDILQKVSLDDLRPSISISTLLQLSDISLKFIESLDALEPFGQGNPQPIFLLKNIHMEYIKNVGIDKSHMQAKIGHCKAIGFRLGHLAHECSQPVDVACKIGIDNWNGRKQPQLFIEDIRKTIGVL